MMEPIAPSVIGLSLGRLTRRGRRCKKFSAAPTYSCCGCMVPTLAAHIQHPTNTDSNHNTTNNAANRRQKQKTPSPNYPSPLETGISGCLGNTSTMYNTRGRHIKTVYRGAKRGRFGVPASSVTTANKLKWILILGG